jgi:hypothetical protein
LTGATLNASVNPSGQDTTVSFQYGTTTSYGLTVGSQDIGSGTNAVQAPQLLSGLSPTTVYHFRVVATNASGTTYGGDEFFTTNTNGGPPTGIIVEQPAGTALISGTSIVNFNSVELGATKPLTFSVINSGTGAVTNLAVSVTGANAAAFIPGAPGATTLGPGAMTMFTVGFDPAATGTFSATLHVTSDDPVPASFDIGLAGSAAAAGFYPIDLGPYSNFFIERAITTVPTPPVGDVTFLGVPFDIPGPLGTLNIWNGDVAAPAGGEAMVTVPVNLPDVSEVHLLLNTWWGQPGVHAHIDLIFDTGTFTRNLIGNDDIRDYENWIFTNHINGVTTVRVFDGHSTLENVPGRIDKMVIPVPPRYQGANLLAVRITDDGHPYFQRILFMGLTVRVGSGISVEEPAGNPLYSGASPVDFGTARIGSKVSREFTVINNGATALNNLKATVTNNNGPEFSAAPKNLPSLAPGESTTFAATYAPTAGGPRTATLYVTSSDPAIPSFEIPLTGTGESLTPQAGAYTGLLNDGSSFITLTLGGARSITGTLVLGGKSYAFTGVLNADGDFTANVGKPPIALALQLDVSGDGSIPGDYLISGSAGGQALTAFHAAYLAGETVAESGTYTMLLTPTDTSNGVPQGTGYGTLTVSPTGGGAMLTGKLADSTPFTAAGQLVGSGSGYNQFILFDPAIYGGKGLLAGAIAFEELPSSDCDGTLFWLKPAQTQGHYYKAGFDTDLALAGSLYLAPPPGQAALDITSGLFELSGGGLENPIQESVTLLPNNTVTVDNSAGQHLQITINPATGMFSGSFIHPLTNKTISFGGLLFQRVPQAGGFFLGPVVDGTGSSGNATLVAP